MVCILHGGSNYLHTSMHICMRANLHACMHGQTIGLATVRQYACIYYLTTMHAAYLTILDTFFAIHVEILVLRFTQ